MQLKNKIIELKSGVLNSYSQIFFSDNKILSVLLIIVSFIDPYAGIMGIIAVLTTNIFAIWLGYDKIKITKGYYGFNVLLVGLGLGIYFQLSLALLVIVVLISILTLLLTLVFEGIIGKYYLPYLSIPFLIAIWIVDLASSEFQSLGISQRGIYLLNDLYSIGGQNFINVFNWFNNLPISPTIQTYFISLGAIFFQYNLLAGILISLGLLYVSRISFSLSIIGYTSAFLFYKMIGSDITQSSYAHIGFNYILTAIALGGFFIISSKKSYLWVVILTPIVAILTISLAKLFSYVGLSVYSLPFNVIVLTFLYALKLRTRFDEGLQEVSTQQNSPEKNLYSYINYNHRFKETITKVPITLPFWGTWTVSQAHNGKETHKDEWKHAWDFIIRDDFGLQFKNTGKNLEDYLCYNKPVLAPASGYIAAVETGIEDNKLGEINIEKNWGNTIVIKHTDLLYSKLSHLISDSITVNIGDYVEQGQQIASCGNSGRSPFPHLHFQLQATPYIGSKTLEYPISNYLVKSIKTEKLIDFGIPKKDEFLLNFEQNAFISNAFKFVPGKSIEYKFIEGNDGIKTGKWTIYVDILNNPYIYCKKTKSTAYFYKDKAFFYFKHFQGNKKSLLYYFFLAFHKINLGFNLNVEITDIINPSMVFSKQKMLLQDFIAPFHIYLKAKYYLKYIFIDDDLMQSELKIETGVSIKNKIRYKFNIQINEKGINKIEILEKGISSVFEIHTKSK